MAKKIVFGVLGAIIGIYFIIEGIGQIHKGAAELKTTPIDHKLTRDMMAVGQTKDEVFKVMNGHADSLSVTNYPGSTKLRVLGYPKMALGNSIGTMIFLFDTLGKTQSAIWSITTKEYFKNKPANNPLLAYSVTALPGTSEISSILDSARRYFGKDSSITLPNMELAYAWPAYKPMAYMMKDATQLLVSVMR